MSEVQQAVERLNERLEEIGGCGSGICIVKPPKGMHTNGGCRCPRDPFKMQRVIHAYKVAVSALTPPTNTKDEALSARETDAG